MHLISLGFQSFLLGSRKGRAARRKCSQSRSPPYQSLITTGPATRASGKQAGERQVSRAPAGAAGSGADRFSVVALAPRPPSPGRPQWRWPALLQGRSLGPGCGTLCLLLGAAGLCVRHGLWRGASAWSAPQSSSLRHAAQGILECPGVRLPIAGHLHCSR